jgi:uncharacterized protein YdiU (UPF0061 family)
MNFGFNFDHSYRELPRKFYALQKPEPVAAPNVVILNEALAQDLGLDFSKCHPSGLADLFSGNELPDAAETFAQAYAGHQYGHFTILGDGRAIVLGEHVAPNGQRYDIQFKGSGRTPYSRNGDGRAALGPMLREYMISESMQALGIPTTRSLAVVTTGESIQRETVLPGAILTRVAHSHIRVGTFEYAASKQDVELLKALLNYTIKRHYPELQEREDRAILFLKAVMEKQADLVVHWMRVGFVHGVMNTDNMAVCGQTIDYGPCAFMDTYDPAAVFSSIDRHGRYAFGNQPTIAQWNVARLAETLLPLLHPDMEQAVTLAEQMVAKFGYIFHDKWVGAMRAKLGMLGEEVDDVPLIRDLLVWMKGVGADYTQTFRSLDLQGLPCESHFESDDFKSWYQRWQRRVLLHSQTIEGARLLMQTQNPAVIPRNHKVEEALAAAVQGDIKPSLAMLKILQHPYEDSLAAKPYQHSPGPGHQPYRTYCGT